MTKTALKTAKIGKTVAAAPADQASAPVNQASAPVKGMRTQKDAAKQLAKPRGGKPGQALRNQSAQYSVEEQNAIKDEAKSRKPSADKIVSVKATTSGPDYIVVKAGDRVVNVPRNRMTGELQKIAKVGASLKAVEAYIAAHKPDAKLGRGITGRDAPQSSKAVADQRHVAKAEPAPTGKTSLVKAAKAAKAERKARGSKMDPATKLTVVTTAAKSGLKAGSDRYLRLQAVEGAKTLGDALQRTIAGGKRIAMDNIQGMVKRGHVKLG